jgi:hypothetical protein
MESFVDAWCSPADPLWWLGSALLGWLSQLPCSSEARPVLWRVAERLSSHERT